MTEQTSNPMAVGSFATLVADAVAARARELSQAWLDAVSQCRARPGTLGGGVNDAAVNDGALSGPVPELVRAFSGTLRDAPVGGAAASVEHELTRLVRLRRAQGHPLGGVVFELGLLQDVLLGALLAEVSAQRERVPAEAVLGIIIRFHETARLMLDVTLRLFEQDVQARRQMRASLLGTFARTVTHELRNRVNAARLSLSVYRSSPEEQQEESLDVLDESLRQLEAAVGDVFSVALAQARELPAEGRLQPLAELLEHLRHDFDELALVGSIEVRVAPPVPHLAVDAGKVQLALLNLVTNALKHVDKSKATRWVEIRVVPGAEGGEWRIEVADNGAGLPGVEMAMGQAEGAPGDEPPAAVMHEVGIVLAHEAVRQLGGRLWIHDNAPGKGTTVAFTVRTPILGVSHP
jgi:signal transduction histidine kinase